MIRFLLDFQTNNIIVLAEKSVAIVDFYYVAHFLKIEQNNEKTYDFSVKETFEKLLEYWKRVLQQDYEEIFLVYDLSDQYISAFCIEKFNFKGRIYTKVTKKHTQQICGHSINIDISNEKLRQADWNQDEAFQLQCDVKTIIRGIDWSIENLRINTNPINLI